MFRNRDIITAIEIGTSKICVLIGESDDSGNMYVLGHGEIQTEGAVCKGEIVDMDMALGLLSKAIDEADNSTSVEIDHKNLYVSVTGFDIISTQGVGTSLIMDEDRRIKEEHVDEAVQSARVKSSPFDQVIINTFDSYFMIDEVRRLRNPVEQIGSKLQAFIHIIYGNRNRIENVETLLHDVGFDDSITPVFAGVASAYGVLTDEEKEDGVLLIELGAGTTEYMVIHNFGIHHSGVLQVGFEHLANDLSIGLDLHISRCRKILTDNRYPQLKQDGKSIIELSGITPGSSRKIPINSLEKIIDLRLREIFQIIRNEIIEKNLIHNIGSGVVLSGGGALFPRTEEILRNVFETPTRIGKPLEVSGAATDLDSPRYSTVWGLLKYGDELRKILNAQENKGFMAKLGDALDNMSKPFSRNLSALKDSIKF
jgi:cell division protein FtsA